ncbi:hypothetical protein ACIPRI_11280 [Variovorax sp. LARHSF232]
MSILTTIITNRNAAKLHSKASQAARAEQHRIFQHDTLAALQDTLDILLKDALQAGTRKKAKTIDLMLGALGAGYTQTERTILKLTQRVADDALRSQLMSILETATMATNTESTDEWNHLCNDLLGAVGSAQEQIGEALRAQY